MSFYLYHDLFLVIERQKDTLLPSIVFILKRKFIIALINIDAVFGLFGVFLQSQSQKEEGVRNFRRYHLADGSGNLPLP